jgi:2-methylcitrate dehydratase PrpD
LAFHQTGKYQKDYSIHTHIQITLQHKIEAQNRFRKNKSTDTASQTFIERIEEASDRGLHATGLYFDLLKECNVINHYILLEKLNHMA